MARARSVNVIVAGLGGQGVIKASDILADAAFRAGLDVKKAEIHGMSQRGGSVTSDVRFGAEVHSPMVPRGEADFLVVLARSEVEVTGPCCGQGGCSSRPSGSRGEAPEQAEPQRGAARHALRPARPPRGMLDGRDEAALPERLLAVNEPAFRLGRGTPRPPRNEAARSASKRPTSFPCTRGAAMMTTWNDPDGGFHPASAPDYLPRAQLRCSSSAASGRWWPWPTSGSSCSASAWRSGGSPRATLKDLRDLGRLPFTVKTRFARHLPLRPVRLPHGRCGAAARLLGHHRQAHRGGLHRGRRAASGRASWSGPSPPAGCTRATSSRTPTATDCSPAAWAAHYGAEALGATVIPISGGNTERQLMVLHGLRGHRHLLHPLLLPPPHRAGRGGRIDVRQAAGRGLRRRALERADARAHPGGAGIRAHDIYGLSEIIGPGVGIECPERKGLHVFEDHFYPEIVDPETGEVLPDGSEGELVLTTLSKQAMPMIRYRTRDITAIDPEPCACGRTLRRIRRIGRRIRRHVHHSRGQRLSVPGGDRPSWRSRGPSRTTRSCSPARGVSTRSRCRSRSPPRSSPTRSVGCSSCRGSWSGRSSTCSASA